MPMTEAATTPPPAEAPAPPPMEMSEMQYTFDNFILFICAVLVIFMQAGFSLVETGLNAAKNAVNIMLKNFMDFCIGALVFYFVGYGLMYPKNFPTTLSDDELKAKVESSYVVFGGSGIPADDQATVGGGVLFKQVDFLFQVAFAATAATIVSGAVAGRIKFPAYIIFTAIMTALIYPISGMWKWGGGWLNAAGFVDFAGSGVVHMIGGFCGLAGALALGPRIGRYVNGKVVPMPGHNLPMVALGVFILMIGWYGFNPGSQLVFTGKGNVSITMLVAVNTTLAGCAGGCAGLFFSWILFKKPDLTLALNGTLAGLVGITANCHCVDNMESIYIGAIAGVLVILGIMLLDKIKIDDPVGAFPVHGLCGAWGVIATGIFGYAATSETDSTNAITLATQLKGAAVYAVWPFVTGLVLFFALKAIGLLRVSAEEETKGLDITEHGMYAYPASQVNESYS
jgi:ammonium transporter, Amt family